MLFIISFLGLAVGSFINALVWRLHENGTGNREHGTERASKKSSILHSPSSKLSIVSGRSMCPDCKHELAPLDLIPVLSWLLLRGRCRYCRKPISPQYPLVELLTAGLFALSYVRLVPASAANWFSFVLWLYILASLIALAVYDLRWLLLPDVILLPAMAAAALRLAVQLIAGAPIQTLVGPVIAALAAGGAFYLLAAVSKGRWMGGGDIKLVFAMGLVLGLRKLGVALFIGFDSAALIGLTLMGLRLRKRSEQIPFGPFLVAGTVIAALYGQSFIDWYLRISGLA